MQLHRSFDESFNIINAVVTTGTFDGVHVGHQTILKRLIRSAKELKGESVLITFNPHPRKVLYPDTIGKDLKLIHSQEEKIQQLATTGLDHLFIIPFTVEFSKINSFSFIEDILKGKLKAKKIIVGFNHHFGYHQEGDYNYLYELRKKFNFEVEEIPEQEVQHESVSSTKIRKALKEGNIGRVNAYLDHHYYILGQTYHPDNMESHDYQFIGIHVDEEEKLIPPAGIYAIKVEFNKLQIKCLLYISQVNSELLLLINEEEKIPGEQPVKLLFYKLLDNNIQPEYFKNQINKAKKEIEDLIY